MRIRTDPNKKAVWTPELARRILADQPDGWAVRKTPHHTKWKKRPWFALVPEERRHIAAAKLTELINRWNAAHPGEKMSPQKYASLHGNAVVYAKYGRHFLPAHSRSAKKFRKQARAYLASLQLAEFKEQPIAKRRKLLL